MGALKLHNDDFSTTSLRVVTDFSGSEKVHSGFFSKHQNTRIDYYPFGMIMPGRSYSSNSYRYGFNGMEKDDEIKGIAGSSYDFGGRNLYDPRIGRFSSIDPWTDKYAWQTPYAYHKNSPIAYIDWNGYGGWDDFLDAAQVTLDVAGLIPGVGIFPDIINAGISTARGDYVGAAASLAAAVPIVGIGAGVAKIGYKAVTKTTAKIAKTTAKTTNKAVAKTAKTVSKSNVPVPKKVNANSVNSKRPTQKYTIEDANGKPYHGVGDVDGKRVNQSLKKLQKDNPSETFKVKDQTNYSNRKDALIQEQKGIDASGGAKSPNNYNKINSPGKKIIENGG